MERFLEAYDFSYGRFTKHDYVLAYSDESEDLYEDELIYSDEMYIDHSEDIPFADPFYWENSEEDLPF